MRPTKFAEILRYKQNSLIQARIPDQVIITKKSGGACGVIDIVIGNEHGDTSSNPGRD